MPTNYNGIQFYDITTLPSVGGAMTIVTVNVTDDDDDGKLEVGDMIDGKEITKITAILNFKVNPADGGEQIDYGGRDPTPDISGDQIVDLGLEYELSDGTKLFIPNKRMNEALVEGTFAEKSLCRHRHNHRWK